MAGAVKGVRDRIRHGYSVLNVEVCFVMWVARVVPSTVDLYDGQVAFAAWSGIRAMNSVRAAGLG